MTICQQLLLLMALLLPPFFMMVTQKVKKIAPNGVTAVYIGGLYDCTDGVCSKKIYAGGQLIAMKTVGSG